MSVNIIKTEVGEREDGAIQLASGGKSPGCFQTSYSAEDSARQQRDRQSKTSAILTLRNLATELSSY